MKIHEKKIAPQWFELRMQGVKDWEIRINDCDYQAGDYLILNEYGDYYNEYGDYYTGRYMVVMITYVAKNVPYLPTDVVVLSTRDTVPVEKEKILEEMARREI